MSGPGWTGERLLDWTGAGSNIRVYGENAHHDLTWTASSTGTVSATLRYDPWGTLSASSGSSLPEHRFQGSWYDPTTDLSWVVSRWYAPSLGRFISEDSLLGEPADPPSRHLYAYGAGEPIGRWDPDGRFWRKVRAGDTLSSLATKYLGSAANWRWIWNRNRLRIKNPNHIQVGWCLWITKGSRKNESCSPRHRITGIFDRNSELAAKTLNVDLRTLTWPRLIALTERKVDRDPVPSGISSWWYQKNSNSIEELVDKYLVDLDHGRVVSRMAGVTWKTGHRSIFLPPSGARAITTGDTVFLRRASDVNDRGLTAHEYIHVLQGEDSGVLLWLGYFGELISSGGSPSNKYEALGYLWEGYINAYGTDELGSFGDNQPWCHFEPIGASWNYCAAQNYP